MSSVLLLLTSSLAHLTVRGTVMGWKVVQRLHHNLRAYHWVEDEAQQLVPEIEGCHTSSFIPPADSLHRVKIRFALAHVSAAWMNICQGI